MAHVKSSHHRPLKDARASQLKAAPASATYESFSPAINSAEKWVKLDAKGDTVAKRNAPPIRSAVPATATKHQAPKKHSQRTIGGRAENSAELWRKNQEEVEEVDELNHAAQALTHIGKSKHNPPLWIDSHHKKEAPAVKPTASSKKEPVKKEVPKDHAGESPEEHAEHANNPPLWQENPQPAKVEAGPKPKEEAKAAPKFAFKTLGKIFKS